MISLFRCLFAARFMKRPPGFTLFEVSEGGTLRVLQTERSRTNFLPLGFPLLAFLAFIFSPMIGFAQMTLGIQSGTVAAIGPHPQAGASQSFVGVRWSTPVDDDPGIELGVLHSSAGYFLDLETYLNEHFRFGDGSGDALLVVGMPFGMLGDPFWISGVDVTFGPGLIVRHPVGPVTVELRGETLTNFLSGIIGLAGSVTEVNYKTGDSRSISGRPFMLLLRLGGDISYPVGPSTELHLGVSHLDFRYWQMTSGVLGLTFEI